MSDHPLNFDGGDATLTFQVQILADNIAELQEQFFLSLNTSSLIVTRNSMILNLSDQERNRIMFEPINGRVNITDDDSKLLGCYNIILFLALSQMLFDLVWVIADIYDNDGNYDIFKDVCSNFWNL